MLQRLTKPVAMGAHVHVRHVVRQFHPAVGGLENTVASLVKALAEQGVEGSVVTLDRQFQRLDEQLEVRDELDGVPITRIPFSGSTRYPLAPSILSQLSGADIVHVHAVDFFFDFLALTKPLHRKTLVASTHGGFFHTEFASRLKKAYFASVTRASARAYASIIASSENDGKTFAKIAPHNTVVIENGVDVEKWHGAACQTATTTLIALGRFSSNKALPDLIALIAKLGAPWRLIIAGHESDQTAAGLNAAAAALKVADRVEVHVGLESSGVHALLKRASYIASASRFEGFGLTAIEGLSAGLIPLLNDIPPFRKLVTETGLGLILDFRSDEESAKIIRAFHDPQAHAARRTAAMAASLRYSWTGVAAHFAAEYRRHYG